MPSLSPGPRCALTAPFHPYPEYGAVCFLWHFPWGFPRRTLSGTLLPWSPDFPLRDELEAAARPADGADVVPNGPCRQGHSIGDRDLSLSPDRGRHAVIPERRRRTRPEGPHRRWGNPTADGAEEARRWSPFSKMSWLWVPGSAARPRNDGAESNWVTTQSAAAVITFTLAQ